MTHFIAVVLNAMMSRMPMLALQFLYTPWQGETATRQVTDPELWWGATTWHPTPQWLLKAWDVDKQAWRDFAVESIKLDSVLVEEQENK